MKRNSFPYRLFQLLHHVDESPDLQAIISWQPHGRSFLIKDKKRLEDEVLPLFFATGNYDSFRRSLNFWGFVQIRGVNSPDFKSYYHKSFLRTRMDLCSKMKRQKPAGGVIKATPCPSSCESPFMEPKFHEMEWLPTTARQEQDEIQKEHPSSGEGDACDTSGSLFLSGGRGPHRTFEQSYSNVPGTTDVLVGNFADRTVNMLVANTDLISASTRWIDDTTFTASAVANNKERAHGSIIATSTEAKEVKPPCLDRMQKAIEVAPLPLDHNNLWQGFLKQQKRLLPNDLSELNSVFD